MRDVTRSRTFARIASLVLLSAVAGCTDPWIVQGGIDFHDTRRPTAFVEGNTPLASWIGSHFGWQSVHPPTWHPAVHPVQPTVQLAQPAEKKTTKPDKTTRKKRKNKKTWILRKPSGALVGGKRLAKQPKCNSQPCARSEGSGFRRSVR